MTENRAPIPGDVEAAVERLRAAADVDGSCPGWIVTKQSDLRTLLASHAAMVERGRLSWNTDMDAAPRDRMIIAMARYPHATAGSPTFVGWGGAKGWLQFSRNAPEPMVCWAWIDRDVFPSWPAEPVQAREGGGL